MSPALRINPDPDGEYRRRRTGRQPPKRRRTWRWLGVAILLLAFVPPLALRWLTPPVSAFMAEAWVGAVIARRSDFYLQQTSLPLAAISPNLALAVIAAEDQQFPHHHGFDLEQVAAALRESRAGGTRGASTLSQQTIKNLLLWPGRSWVRKGLEAWYTIGLELFCSKQRILELYLNFAQFGDGIYGASAASKNYFGSAAAELGAEESALLAAVLPNPRRLRTVPSSAQVRVRQQWILRQMRQLGGVGYLRELQ